MTRMASIDQFTQSIALVTRSFKWQSGKEGILQSIATALSSDTTKHDLTITKPPLALQIGKRGSPPFASRVNAIVNKGKAGNLSTTEMSNAITAGLSEFFPPRMTSPPAISGTTAVGDSLSCTMGNWTYVPTSYTYQWLRAGAPIGGATANTHTIVAADQGANLACMVTAHNAAGSTGAASNTIAVP